LLSGVAAASALGLRSCSRAHAGDRAITVPAQRTPAEPTPSRVEAT
jgi:hypothetical protein